MVGGLSRAVEIVGGKPGLFASVLSFAYLAAFFQSLSQQQPFPIGGLKLKRVGIRLDRETGLSRFFQRHSQADPRAVLTRMSSYGQSEALPGIGVVAKLQVGVAEVAQGISPFRRKNVVKAGGQSEAVDCVLSVAVPS